MNGFVYAQLNDDAIAVAVVNVYAELEGSQHVRLPEFDSSLLGKRWTGADWEAVEPEPMPLDLRITKLAFRNRFTEAEKALIEFAALDDPSKTQQERMQAAGLRAYLKDVDAAKHIDLDRADTQSGVRKLEVLGLISAGRADEILSNEIADVERYKE